MGQDKARLVIDGETLAGRAARLQCQPTIFLQAFYGIPKPLFNQIIDGDIGSNLPYHPHTDN